MESKELEVGGNAVYEINGTTITMTPVTLGKMKKAMGELVKAGNSFDVILNTLAEILDNGKNPTANREWIENNITLPTAHKMIDDMRRINGLGDFLENGATPQARTRDLQEKAPEIPSV